MSREQDDLRQELRERRMRIQWPANARDLTQEQWLEIHREAGRRIDPATCEETWIYTRIVDPYDLDPDGLPDACDHVGRVEFYRSPGSENWVIWEHLSPQAALNTKHRRERSIAAADDSDDMPF